MQDYQYRKRIYEEMLRSSRAGGLWLMVGESRQFLAADGWRLAADSVSKWRGERHHYCHIAPRFTHIP